MIKNTVEQYGVVSKIFHWLMALLILFMFVVGFLLDKLKAPLLYDAHKAIGFILLFCLLNGHGGGGLEQNTLLLVI